MSDFCTQADAMLAQLIAWRRDDQEAVAALYEEDKQAE